MHKILGWFAEADTLRCLNTFVVDESHVQTGRQVSFNSPVGAIRRVRKELGKRRTGNQEEGSSRAAWGSKTQAESLIESRSIRGRKTVGLGTKRR